MVQYVDLLRALVKEKIQSLKQDKYLANADWIFIENNFQIENPHTKDMIENDNREIDLINHGLSCSNCHQALLTEFSQAKYDDLVAEARIHIINIQKVLMSLIILNIYFCLCSLVDEFLETI